MDVEMAFLRPNFVVRYCARGFWRQHGEDENNLQLHRVRGAVAEMARTMPALHGMEHTGREHCRVGRKGG